MEKNIWLTHAETAALIEASVFSYADTDEQAANSALEKLGDLYREFAVDESGIRRLPAGKELSRAA